VPDFSKNAFQLPDLDQEIYRIFPTKYALALFETNQNVLVQPAMWDDPFENFFLNATGLDSSGNLIGLGNIRNSWYGQCWTATPESDAMWRIYSHRKDGVRLGTTVRKLFNSFYDANDPYASLKFFIGKVQYVNQDDVSQFAHNIQFADVAFGAGNQNFASLLLIKRLEFQHENEVRLLYCDAEGKQANQKIVRFGLSSNSIIDSIVFDPRLEFNKFAFRSEKFANAGFKGNITRSKLYEAPKLVINIG
jgi:hypothetical protein